VISRLFPTRPHAARALAALLAVLLCTPLAAQSEGDPSIAESERILSDRQREVIHPGIPIDLVGIEQGDNSFRDRTPALENSDGLVAVVDREELYRRRLALYSGATITQSMPSRRGRPDAANSAVPLDRAARAIAVEESDDEPSGMILWFSGMAAVLLLGFALKRLN